MRCDCHMHMVLDGVDWRASIGRHRNGPDDDWIRQTLARYQSLGFTYLRDGGDRWGVGARARALAEGYAIRYRTPLAPICKAGHYGGFIGEQYTDLKDYARLVKQHRRAGCDFIKLMISGLMDFDHCGVLTEEGLRPEELAELIHIAKEEGFSVMAHANGARTVEVAARAGVDSVEHGAYLDRDAMEAMKGAHVIWVPTLSTVGNLRGKGRFREAAVEAILESAMENVAAFGAMGGLLAPGSDAGAWAVPHGCTAEEQLLGQCLGPEAPEILARGANAVIQRF